MKTIPSSIFAITAFIALNAFAEERYVCSHGDAERIIEVVYLSTDAPVPCEVTYSKEGNQQTLWSAQNEAGYCESKAQELAQKQAGWGWSCTGLDPKSSAGE